MTKLIIQIPCYNEEQTLGKTLSELPRVVPGIDRVEWLVINDGSSDRTSEVARTLGVDHVVELPQHRGLATAFLSGIEACLRAGADVIVNTDADNQYRAQDIPVLIAPVLAGKADIVIGARPIEQIRRFSRSRRFLQRAGSWAVRVASQTDIPDATSGFRAVSRNAALQPNFFGVYTYTLEMIIQAGQKGIAITSVPIRTNEDLRPSRLIKSVPSYIGQSILTLLRVFVVYRPLRFFFILGCIALGAGGLLGVRWLVLFLSGTARTHLPSLILAAVLLIWGLLLWIFGLAADLVAANRMLLEDIQVRARRSEMDSGAQAAAGQPPDVRPPRQRDTPASRA
jgi:glycosyltransferase involved in cell wall biosynthesis